MGKRSASTYAPDSTIEGVSPQDIQDNCVENRHIADDEIDGAKLGTLENNDAPLIAITKEVTTGSADVKIYDADAPFKFEIVDVIVQPRGASTNGTIKLTDGTNDITDAIVCAVDKTIGRASTIDNDYSEIAADGTLQIVCAGDVVASTVGLVTVLVIKKD